MAEEINADKDDCRCGCCGVVRAEAPIVGLVVKSNELDDDVKSPEHDAADKPHMSCSGRLHKLKMDALHKEIADDIERRKKAIDAVCADTSLPREDVKQHLDYDEQSCKWWLRFPGFWPIQVSFYEFNGKHGCVYVVHGRTFMVFPWETYHNMLGSALQDAQR